MSVILLPDENGEDITNEQLCYVEPDCLGEPWCTAWGICSENKAKNLEIHQEEPTTSETRCSVEHGTRALTALG